MTNFTLVNSELIKDIPIVFLTGSSRSGTTLLSNILNSHENVISCPENGFMHTHISAYGRKKRFSKGQVRRFVKNLWVRKRFMKEVWALDESKLEQQLQATRDTLSFSYACKHIYNMFGKGKEAKTFVDKGPSYLLSTKRLDRVFGKPKYIVIVRDYRDRYVSLKKLKKYSPLKMIESRGFIWSVHQRRALRLKTQSPDRTFLVLYEDLISKPEEILKTMCEFLGLSFSTNMLNHDQHQSSSYGQDSENKRKQHFKDSHSKSLTGIDSSNMKKYADKLTSGEIGRLDYACSRIGKEFGYEVDPTGKRPNFFQKLSVKLKLLFAGFTKVPQRMFMATPLRFQAFLINGMHKLVYSK